MSYIGYIKIPARDIMYYLLLLERLGIRLSPISALFQYSPNIIIVLQN